MPFVAIRKDTKERIDITEIQNPRLELKSGECLCQLCGEPLIVKAGLVISAHFAHYANRECKTEYKYHPESPEHRAAKTTLISLLKTSYEEYTRATFEKEVPIKEIKRVADVLVEFPMGWRVAHEIQLAKIDTESLQERTNDYYREGIDVVWWLGKSANTTPNRDWCVKNFGYCLILNIEPVTENKVWSL